MLEGLHLKILVEWTRKTEMFSLVYLGEKEKKLIGQVMKSTLVCFKILCQSVQSQFTEWSHIQGSCVYIMCDMLSVDAVN